MSRWMIHACMTAAIAAFASLASAEPAAPPPAAVPAPLDPFAHSPVVPNVAVEGEPVVGGEIVAIMAVMAREAVSDVRMQVVLPAGVQQSGGESSWSGSLAAGEVRILQVPATVLKAGRQQIIGRVTVLHGDVQPTVLAADRWVDVPPVKPKK